MIFVMIRKKNTYTVWTKYRFLSVKPDINTLTIRL